MKTISINSLFGIAILVLKTLHTAEAQGTIRFNDPWINNGVGYFSLVQFNGFSFRFGNRVRPYDNMIHIGATGPPDYPHNGTPYAAFVNTLGTPQYMLFAWTNAATFGDHSFTSGAPFGLVSVDLADPVSPSPSSLSITFNGFKTDGSTVSQTFTTPGNGATGFQTYQFGPDFALGLARVEMPSPFWAMDNIAWVPEPGVESLLVVGALVIAVRKRRRRQSREN